MNKVDLINKLAKRQGLSKAESARVVETFFDAMSAELCNGKRVEIRGFCSFKIKTYPGYTRRNPMTGELVTVCAKKRPFFKAGTELKKQVNI